MDVRSSSERQKEVKTMTRLFGSSFSSCWTHLFVIQVTIVKLSTVTLGLPQSVEPQRYAILCMSGTFVFSCCKNAAVWNGSCHFLQIAVSKLGCIIDTTRPSRIFVTLRTIYRAFNLRQDLRRIKLGQKQNSFHLIDLLITSGTTCACSIKVLVLVFKG